MSRSRHRALPALLVVGALVACSGGGAVPAGYPSSSDLGLAEDASVTEDDDFVAVGDCRPEESGSAQLLRADGGQLRYTQGDVYVNVAVYGLPSAADASDAVAVLAGSPSACSSDDFPVQPDEASRLEVAEATDLPLESVAAVDGALVSPGGDPYQSFRRAAAALGDGRVVVVTVASPSDRVSTVVESAAAAVEAARSVDGVPSTADVPAA